MKKLLLILSLLVSLVSYSQYPPSGLKQQLKNGIALGSRNRGEFTVNDSLVLVIDRSGKLLWRENGTNATWKVALDSASGGTGTVTSIATNNGSGINGGTITTSGTLSIDTLNISTRLFRIKGTDSLAGLIALRVRIADTANMLSTYQRILANYSTTYALSNDVRDSIQTKLALRDTSGMLSGYARTGNVPSLSGVVKYTDTASMLTPYTRVSRFNDSLSAIQGRIQTKQPLGNYLTFADSLSGGYTTWLRTKKVIDSLAGATVSGVSSFNSRTGAVTPLVGDYSSFYKGIADSFFVTGFTTRGRTKQLSDSLAATKVNYTDTATMLGGYTRVQRFLDSMSAVQSRVQTKLALSGGTMAGNIDMGTYSISNVNNLGVANLSVGGTAILPTPTTVQPSVITTGISGLLVRNAESLLREISGATMLSYIGAGNVFGSFTAGQVAFPTSSNTLSGSSNLFWDNTNARLGIGTSSPLTRLHLSTGSSDNNVFRMTSDAGRANVISFISSDGNVQGGFLGTGTSFSYGTYEGRQVNLSGGAGGIGLRLSSTGTNSNLRVYTGNADGDFGTATFSVLGSNGRVLVNTTTDNGVDNVQVNGSLIATTLKSTTNTVSGNSTIGGTLGVTGATTLSSTLFANSSGNNIRVGSAAATTTNDGGIFTSTDVIYFSNWAANRGWLINTSTNTISTLGSGNLSIGGTLGVTGVGTFSSDLNAAQLNVSQVSVTSNQIFRNSSSIFYVNFSGTGTTQIGNSTSNTVITNNATIGGTLGVTGAGTFSNLSGTGTRVVEASSAGLLSATKIIDAGTYAPTIDGQSNCSSVSVSNAKYSQVGKVVTVSGMISYTVTSGASSFSFRITIPTGTIAVQEDLVGSIMAISYPPAYPTVTVDGYTSTSTKMNFSGSGSTGVSYTYQFLAHYIMQ